MTGRLAVGLGRVAADRAAVQTPVDRHRPVLATLKVGTNSPDRLAQRSCFDRFTDLPQLIAQSLRITRWVTLGYTSIDSPVTHRLGSALACYSFMDIRPCSYRVSSGWAHQK